MCKCTRVFDEGKGLCEGPADEGDKSRGQLLMSEGGCVDETMRLLTNKLEQSRLLYLVYLYLTSCYNF